MYPEGNETDLIIASQIVFPSQKIVRSYPPVDLFMIYMQYKIIHSNISYYTFAS